MDETVISIPIAQMSLAQLVQLSQGFGRDIDKLRDQRAYLRAKINERLAAGQRDETPGDGDALAPGVVIKAQALG